MGESVDGRSTASVRQCALPGCDELIEVVPDRPERRYCTAAHRASARRARRAAAQSEGDRRLAETLPWLREPETEPEPVRTVTLAPAAPERPAERPSTARPRGGRPRQRGGRVLEPHQPQRGER